MPEQAAFLTATSVIGPYKAGTSCSSMTHSASSCGPSCPPLTYSSFVSHLPSSAVYHGRVVPQATSCCDDTVGNGHGLDGAVSPQGSLMSFGASESRLHVERASPGQDFYGIPNPLPGTNLKLSDLRERLIRQEETIIFALIERAQFKRNKLIYMPDAFSIPGFKGTFSQYLLYEVEKVYATVRRYTSPDEHPFSSVDSLPTPLLPPLTYPPTLIPNKINCNADVEHVYIESIVPAICEAGDDQNYGSAAASDVSCLQALSKRVHYGKFIAEAKYAAEPQTYARLARAEDRDGIWELLSDVDVEKVLLARVENKARNYGVDVTDGGTGNNYKVEPKRIMEIYRDFIVPLTKVVEVEYLMVRHLEKEHGADGDR